MAIRNRGRSTRHEAARTGGPRKKISVTVESTAVAAVSRVTGNLSAFVNDAIKEKLYFRQLDEELDTLEREGVKLNEAGYRWLMERIETTDKRRRQRK
jgi:hypothetical protein